MGKAKKEGTGEGSISPKIKTKEEDAPFPSTRGPGSVDRRVFVEAVLVFSPSSSEDEGDEEEIEIEQETDEEEIEIEQEKGEANEGKPPVCLKDVNARRLLEEGAADDVKNSDGDGLFQVKPKVVLARADRQEEDDDDEKQAMDLASEVFGNEEKESELKVAHHNKSSRDDLILGGQKEDGNKEKSSKKTQSKEKGPSSSETDNDEPMNEEEETNAKGKSTRSGRRKRRNGDLKMSTKRKQAYGIVKPKRPKNH